MWISLFLIIIIPINFINYEDTEQTSIFTQIVHRGDFISETIIENKPDVDDEFFAANENHIIIKAPMIGTFYRKSAPDKDVFTDVGKSVAEGDVLCVIEAMKLFTEIE